MNQEQIEALLAAHSQEQPEELSSPSRAAEQEPEAQEPLDAMALDRRALEEILAKREQAQPKGPIPHRPVDPPSAGMEGDQTSQVQTQPLGPARVTVRPARFTQLANPQGNEPQGLAGNDLGILLDVPVRVTVELGRAELPVREVLELGTGSVIELDRSAGEALDILVNGVVIAQGEVVVVGEQFGIRLLEILSSPGRYA
jgi:flagellar motor switch protein FliN/FliY